MVKSTVLLGTGGRGCCGPGIRTITATVAASATPTAELTVLTLVAEDSPPKPTLLPTLPLRPPVQVSPRRSRRKRRYGKNAIQNFFITISLH